VEGRGGDLSSSLWRGGWGVGGDGRGAEEKARETEEVGKKGRRSVRGEGGEGKEGRILFFKKLVSNEAVVLP
jgi:hypothetical protein